MVWLLLLLKLIAFVLLPLAVVGWLVRRAIGPQRFVKLAAKVTLLAIVTVIGLVLGEFAVRIALRDVTTTSDNSSWFARRWMKTVETNRLGFRERNFEPLKPDGVYRVAVVGDSITWGQGVDVDARFSDRLQSMLEAAVPNAFEVLNFGTAGDELTDHANTIDEVARAAQPDFILLQFYWNDWEGDDKSGRPGSWPLLPSSILHQQFRKRSALYYLLNVQWGRLQRAVRDSPSTEEYLKARFGDPSGPASTRARGQLEDLLGRADRAGIPLAIALFPDLLPEHRLDFIHRQVLDVCAARGLICIDLAPELAGRPDARDLWANAFDMHPGGEAHGKAADTIFSALGPVWLADREGRWQVAAPSLTTPGPGALEGGSEGGK